MPKYSGYPSRAPLHSSPLLAAKYRSTQYFHPSNILFSTYELPSLQVQYHSVITPSDAGMRKHFASSQAVRAIFPRRSLVQSRPRCLPELTSSTSAKADDAPLSQKKTLPFCFETGLSLYAKRSPRPFPPPFLSPPSGSFSDPLSTHRGRVQVNGETMRGLTNGDDAAYASEYFIGVNDGVGAWSTRPGGHAG